MKRFILMSAFVLVANMAFAQAERTFVKSFNLKGDNQVVLNLDGAVEVKEWDEEIVRVMMNVSFENANDNAIRFFAERGRYRILQKAENGTMLISNMARSGNIKYQGREVGEVVTYTVYVPNGTSVEVEGAETVSNTSSDTNIK